MSVEIDIGPRPEGAFRIVVWTVGASVERKYPKIEAFDTHLLIAPRVGSESRLLRANRDSHSSMAWVGRYPQRGLGALAFDDSFVKLDSMRWDQRLEWIAPLQVSGVVPFQVLAMWALNEKARVSFKTNPPAWQAIQAVRLYRTFLNKPTIFAGDFNNNPVFHRNDPNWDMLEFVALLQAEGLVSLYHHFFELEHGDPRELATRFRPNGEGGEEAHHVDYCFVPEAWLPALLNVQVGSREIWAKTKRTEEHLPLVFDFDLDQLHHTNRIMRKSG